MGGKNVRRDVWVELFDDGQYQVRWRGGEWTDRDGSFRTRNKLRAWWAVKELIDDGEDWKRVDTIQPVASSRAPKMSKG